MDPQKRHRSSFRFDIPTSFISRPPRATRLRQSRPIEIAGTLCPRIVPLCLALLLALTQCPPAAAQQAGADPVPTTDQIVQRLVTRNQERAEQLGPYTSRRHYHIAYRGFPHAAEADMVVDAAFDGPSSRHFQVVSESGSHLLLDHVLLKLLRTEQDSSRDRAETALTPANYNFTLLRTDTDEGRLMFVLNVDPKKPRVLLYRGTIWVDAKDYAVVRIEAQPAKNLSFWIRNTSIHHVYEKTGDFWLPQSNRSETKVRLGGTAILTIDYGDYRFANRETIQPAAAEVAATPTALK